jgi:hypothetical protein
LELSLRQPKPSNGLAKKETSFGIFKTRAEIGSKLLLMFARM